MIQLPKNYEPPLKWKECMISTKRLLPLLINQQGNSLQISYIQDSRSDALRVFFTKSAAAMQKLHLSPLTVVCSCLRDLRRVCLRESTFSDHILTVHILFNLGALFVAGVVKVHYHS